jgi:2-polyprenyl-3-methyl-5-hydroxy-6-metoxy-1,4-benzoquinol methylase
VSSTTSDWRTFYRDRKIDLKLIVDTVNGQREYIERIQKYAKGPRLLETGVGTGITSIYLSCLSYDVTGIDNNREIVQTAATRNAALGGRARFEEMDLFNLEFEPDSFDLCFHQGVLEHFCEAEIVTALREQLRVARTVVFSVPSHLYPQRDYGDEHLWSVEQWQRVLAGLHVVETFGYNYAPALVDRLNQLNRRYSRLPYRAIPMRFWPSKRVNPLLYSREIGFVIMRGN